MVENSEGLGKVLGFIGGVLKFIVCYTAFLMESSD
jgi:hypothetical protein